MARELRLKLALTDLECKGFDQGCLLAVIQTQLAGVLIDQLDLPGHQGETILERIQGLGVQINVIRRVIEQAVNVQGKLGDRFQCQRFSPARKLEQGAAHAVDGVLVVADQLQVTQAFFGLGQECFSLDKKFGKALCPVFAVDWHAYLHSVMSDEGMPCVSTIVNRRETAPRRASAQTEGVERIRFHRTAIAHNSLTPFMQ